MNYVTMHNERFPKMWNIINKHTNFTDKIVIDAGCGYGDFARAVSQSGAKKVYAIDNNPKLTKSLTNIDNVIPVQANINEWDDEYYPFKNCKQADILACFSVLPYLDNPDMALSLFAKMAEVVLIECQYFEDGPGFDFLMNDTDMELWLRAYWSKAKPIGRTYIQNRSKYRTIWVCE